MDKVLSRNKFFGSGLLSKVGTLVLFAIALCSGYAIVYMLPLALVYGCTAFFALVAKKEKVLVLLDIIGTFWLMTGALLLGSLALSLFAPGIFR